MAVASVDEPNVECNPEVQVSLTRIETDKSYRKSKMENILHSLVALFNSFGGILKIYLEASENLESLSRKQDGLIRSIEQQISEKVGSIKTSEKIKTIRGEKEIIIEVTGSPELITQDYHLYVPTNSQILPVRSFEPVDEIIYSKIKPGQVLELTEHCLRKDFNLGEIIGKESRTIQFKNLKSEPAKCVSLSDRISRGNKFKNTVSAFANCFGGCIFYGISDSGMVIGQEVSERERDLIIKKVTKVIDNMAWPKGCDAPRRGKQWDIFFKPVKDVEGNKIESLFVIIITISQCPGGVYTEKPVSYHIVDGEVREMDFPTWQRKCSQREDVEMISSKQTLCKNSSSGPCEVPKGLKRIKWSSDAHEKKYNRCTVKWERFRKTGEWKLVDRLSKEYDKKNPDDELVATFQMANVSIMQGMIKKAQEFSEKFYERETSALNVHIFELDGIYLRLVLGRYEGSFEVSLTLAEEGLQRMESIHPCLTTAWLHCEIATTLSIHACHDFPLDSQRANDLFKRAKNCCEIALEHTQDLNFEEALCDIRCKVHVLLAMIHVKTSLNGCTLDMNASVSMKDVETARFHLDEAEKLTEICPPYNFNFCLRHLAACDACYRMSQIDISRSSQLFNQAITFAQDASNLADTCKFDELHRYASNRLELLNAKQHDVSVK